MIYIIYIIYIYHINTHKYIHTPPSLSYRKINCAANICDRSGIIQTKQFPMSRHGCPGLVHESFHSVTILSRYVTVSCICSSGRCSSTSLTPACLIIISHCLSQRSFKLFLEITRTLTPGHVGVPKCAWPLISSTYVKHLSWMLIRNKFFISSLS